MYVCYAYEFAKYRCKVFFLGYVISIRKPFVEFSCHVKEAASASFVVTSSVSFKYSLWLFPSLHFLGCDRQKG